MRFQRLRRALLAAACVSSFLLASCGGGGDVVSRFQPSRLVVFGDAFSDLGQRGVRYTVNDGALNNWTEQLAARYGLGVAASANGGTSYAIGSARTAARPDAQGNAATPTIAEQVDGFLAAQPPQANDLIVVSGGIADVIAAANAGSAAQAEQAGRDLGAQVQRLVGAGAKHVLVVGTYNLGRSPWARTILGNEPLVTDLSSRFNNELLKSIVNLGSTVLYVDASYYFNLVSGNPSVYGFNDVTNTACNSVDPGVGIGVGAGRVSSTLCTPSTLQTDPNATLFADPVYFTRSAHVQFGDYAHDRLVSRF
ncbi:MAG TPA: SGNH/GDSL hydrolase family protein [Ramlibacter sp.]|jgi:phospholipase/lecithinase/hemolysin|uniref:SGNH/GDSL hydrolase family protein n=1 Tax=Ramlibacter sp. TaxID=1917967 RepID=UPI002D6820DA|nr:SGNH/GDSL hydrolase family protein [Ramlibacter sp.]HZY17084.1 SGNH/GDSL hydrolase family protein [Ramlibacter sp.]